MHELLGKQVEVGTVDMTYSGKLVEVTDSEVQLETPSGWVSIPVGQVTFIRRKSSVGFVPDFEFLQ